MVTDSANTITSKVSSSLYHINNTGWRSQPYQDGKNKPGKASVRQNFVVNPHTERAPRITVWSNNGHVCFEVSSPDSGSDISLMSKEKFHQL